MRSAPVASRLAISRRARSSADASRPACSSSAPQQPCSRGATHLAAVGGQHARRGRVDVAEERPLHAAEQHRDAQPRRALGRRDRGHPARDAAHRQRGRERLRLAQPDGRHACSARAAHGALQAARAVGDQRRAEHRAGARGTAAAGTARRAARRSAGRALEAALDLLPRRLDQAVVADAGGADRHARHAAEARVPVRDTVVRREADLPSLREVHQQDAAARRVHLLAPQHVGRAGGQAEPAVHAVVEQRALGRMVQVERDVGRLGPRRGRSAAAGGATRSRRRASRGRLVACRPGASVPVRIELLLDGAHQRPRATGSRLGPHQVVRSRRSSGAATTWPPSASTSRRAARAPRSGSAVSAQPRRRRSARSTSASAPALGAAQQVAEPRRRHADRRHRALAVPRRGPRGRPSARRPRRRPARARRARAPRRAAACSLGAVRRSTPPAPAARRRATRASQAAGTTGAVASARGERRRRASGVARRAPRCGRVGHGMQPEGDLGDDGERAERAAQQLAPGRSRRRS